MRQQINLFNAAIEPTSVAVSAKHITYLAGLSIVISSLYYVQLVQQESALLLKKQETVAAVNLTTSKLKERVITLSVKNSPQDEERVNQKERALKEINATIDQLKEVPSGLPKGYSAYFTDLAEAQINGLWLTKIEIKGLETKVNLSGKAINPALLPELLNTLQVAPAFEGLAFGGFKMYPLRETISGYPMAMGFELTADNPRNTTLQTATTR